MAHTTFSRTVDPEEARDAANAWVARFAPLVMENDALTPAEARERLGLLASLQAEGPSLRSRLAACATPDDDTLILTFDRALAQLDSIETDLRKRLARLVPGDPEGIADLQELNERLAERQARQEIGLPTESEVPAVLELRTSPSNLAGALGMGLFGLGWTSFTAFHATLMIGGMMKAFGWRALALLGFYSIFFAVGFAMLFGAVNAASTETIELDGRTLTVRRKLGGWLRQKTYKLPLKSSGSIEIMPSSNTSNRSVPTRSIVLVDDQGRPVSIASGTTEAQRKAMLERINAYLAATERTAII